MLQAQQKDKVLLTIADRPVYTSEFKRVYLKNIDLVKDDTQKDVDEYLDLFINYKLKLQEAIAVGLDQKESHKNELAGYKKQLAANYLTDTQATEALIKEAYERSQARVNASHILIKVNKNATPEDTLKAYQKIIDLRTKIINGEDFKTIAKQFSEDPSAKRNNGDLGWFSAFRMVYPFEDAAFKTAVGEVTKPFRTQFGYHILKVNAKEKLEGEVTVAHIMVSKNDKRTFKEAEDKIKEIETQLAQGASFEALAKQFSDDRNTAVNGGKINRFGKGALNSVDFEKAAFSLKAKGEVSKPIRTTYGWHIIKLLEKHPLPSFESQKSELAKKVKRDSRSQLVTTSFINGLKRKYQIVSNTEAIKEFKEKTPEALLSGKKEMSKELLVEKEFLRIDKKQYTYKDFATFLQDRSLRRNRFKDINTLVAETFKIFERNKILEYYEAHLEDDNEEFAQVYNEYRDGLLLFDLMETQIWNKAKEDSLGLKQYFESHKTNYKEKESYEIIKVSSTDKVAIQKVKTLLNEGKNIEEIKTAINKENTNKIIVTSEKISKDNAILPEDFKGEKGIVELIEDNSYYTLIKIEEVYKSRNKTLDEVKGKVLNDYQVKIEENWLKGLHKKYPVTIHKRVLKKIKKELQG